MIKTPIVGYPPIKSSTFLLPILVVLLHSKLAKRTTLKEQIPVPAAYSSALYYPYIEINDEKWLRSAALFWDSIQTIVPVSIKDPYSNDFARALADEGVLKPVRVSSDMDEIEELTDKVLDFLTDPASAGVMFDTDNNPTHRIHTDKMSYRLHELTNIHPDKLPYMIRTELKRWIDSDGWSRVAPGFANFYMTLLASQLAQRLGLGLVTESSAADQLAIAVRKGNPLGTSGNRQKGRGVDTFGPRRFLPTEVAPSLLIDLMVQGVSLPEQLSVKELLKFKKYHTEELAVFRREVARLTTDLPTDMPIEALRQAVSDRYKANVVPAMSSLRESLRAQNWDAGLNGLLKVSFFTAAPTSAAILAGVPSSIALLAGVGVSLTATVVLSANQRKRTRIESPYSYLLSIERQW